MPCDLSVLLPIYEGKKYLRLALESLWRQSYKQFEVLAIDDGSTDGSVKIVEAYAQSGYPIRLLRQSHQGIVSALNYGLKEAKGSLIARMDADDVAYPKRFEKQVQFLEAHPEVVAVGSWVRFVDPVGAPFFTYKVPIEHGLIEADLWKGNGGAMIHPSVCFRKSALMAIGGYREAYRSVEDLDVYIRLLDLGSLYNIPDVLLDYRQHFKSVNFVSHHESRRLLTQNLMDEHCRRKGRSCISFLSDGVHEKNRLAIYQQWASWALQEGFKKTALKYAIKGCLHNPFKRTSWSFLKYILTGLL